MNPRHHIDDKSPFLHESQLMLPLNRIRLTLCGKQLIPATMTPTGTPNTVFHPLSARLAVGSRTGTAIASGRAESSSFGKKGKRYVYHGDVYTQHQPHSHALKKVRTPHNSLFPSTTLNSTPHNSGQIHRVPNPISRSARSTVPRSPDAMMRCSVARFWVSHADQK